VGGWGGSTLRAFSSRSRVYLDRVRVRRKVKRVRKKKKIKGAGRATPGKNDLLEGKRQRGGSGVDHPRNLTPKKHMHVWGKGHAASRSRKFCGVQPKKK